jgi:micrococcal nuclease
MLLHKNAYIESDGIDTQWLQVLKECGVDTPESRKNKKAKKDAARSKKDVDTITALGKESTAHTKKLLKNKKEVYIETDVQEKDKYGRTLGYVYLDKDKKEMLNEMIIADGYGAVMTVPPNVKYEKKFLKSQKKARKKKKGLWDKY